MTRFYIPAMLALLLSGCGENSMGGSNGCVTLRAGPPVEARDIADCAADKAANRAARHEGE